MNIMKKVLVIVAIILFSSCNNDSSPNCFQNSGTVILKEFPVTAFSKITVFDHVELILREGQNHKVTVATGEFLMSDIDVILEGDRLKLYDNN